MDSKKITKVTQISMTVKDIETTIKNFEEGYGIGPWIIGDDNDLFFEHNTVEVHNKPLNFGFKIALYKGLNIDLELIQPLDEKGVYAEFLKEHGQGIHHIALSFEDENDYINTVEERGNEKIQTGLFISKSRGKKMRVTYHDMREDIGIISEIMHEISDL